jgi:hypothetical protein
MHPCSKLAVFRLEPGECPSQRTAEVEATPDAIASVVSGGLFG